MSLAEPFRSVTAKRAVVSFRTPANVVVAPAAMAFHNFLYEDLCVAAGRCRISVGCLSAFSEEDANGGGRHCFYAGGQHQRSADGLTANRER